jgi:hypothetical protein
VTHPARPRLAVPFLAGHEYPARDSAAPGPGGHAAPTRRVARSRGVGRRRVRDHRPRQFAEEILAKAWPNDRDAEIISKAATAPTTTASAPALGQMIAADFIGALTGIAAAPELIVVAPLRLSSGRTPLFQSPR